MFSSKSRLLPAFRWACGSVAIWLLPLLPLNGRSAEAAADLSEQALVTRIAEGIRLLNQAYWSPVLSIWIDRPGDLRGYYQRRRNPPWWPSANAVETLIDFMNASRTSEYDSSIEALYELQKDHATRMDRVVAELRRQGDWSEADEAAWQRRRERPTRQKPSSSSPAEYYSDFQNEYLDDSGWWGITWLKMYDRTKAARYLDTARTIHAHMARNWNPEKGGGVMWSEDSDKQRPNAITNNLFLILSARLFARTQDRTYLDWAEKTVRWIDEQKLYDGTAVVDAPGHNGDYWSYNQGTYLGGLAAMVEATGDVKYAVRAAQIAESILNGSGLVSPDRVLVEKLGTRGDASLFKGVFARYLAQLRDVLRSRRIQPETSDAIDGVLRASAASMLQYSTVANGMFTAEWHLGAQDCSVDFNTQTSGLAGLVALLNTSGR
jgi:predicted alpha-1,6-mannanase (GH76 family)